MSSASEDIAQGLDEIRRSAFVSGATKKSYKQGSPQEAPRVFSYLDGGAEPRPFPTTLMGSGLTKVERGRRTMVPPPPDPPATGTLIWNGDLDTGDESQFTNYIRNAPDRWRVTTADGAVTPRRGTHMARVEVRQGESPSWGSTLSATLAVRQIPTVGYNQTYPDVYFGWSAWVPSDFPYANPNMHSIFMEWHGNGSMIQAPFHWGILAAGGNAGRFFIDLHRDPTAYAPIIQPAFDPLSVMGDAWHDYVCRIKWSMGGDGVLQFWQDGALRHTYNGPTAPLTGESIKLQAGIYMANAAPASKHIYLDGIKVGTSYESVAPV